MSWRVTRSTRFDEDLTIPLSEEVFTIMNRTYKVENYTDPVVHVFARDQNGNRVEEVIRGFTPYFYGGYENVSKLRNPINSILGKAVEYVPLQLPKHTVKKRKEYDYHCGANIYFEDRWYWDSGIRVTYKKQGDKLIPVDPGTIPIVPRRILYFDTEALGPKEQFADETVPNVPVIMIQTLDNYSKIVEVYYLDSPHWKGITEDVEVWEGMELPNGVYWPYPVYFVKCEVMDEDGQVDNRQSEIELFRRFAGRCVETDPDDYAGWNINYYDWQKLNNRARELGCQNVLRRVSPVNWYTIRGKRDDDSRWKGKTSVKINGRCSVDMLDVYKQQTKPDGEEPGYSLKEVLRRRVGIEYDELGPYMQDVWKDPHGRERLWKYGVLDVIGLYILNEAPEELQGTNEEGQKYRCMNMWHQPEVVRRISGCSFTDTFKKIRMLHPMLWRYIPGKPIPTAKYGQDEEGEDVEGGYVFDPVIGMHMFTGVLDFKGMYPSIFIGYNMGQDTLLTVEQVSQLEPHEYVTVKYDYKGVEREVYFDLRFDSSLRILGRHLVEMRESYRKKGHELLEQITIGEATEEDWYFNMLFEINAKFMANSIYGVNNYGGWPMFCPPVANAITGVGRDQIKFIARKIKEEFPDVVIVYGDTDGLHVKVKAENLDEAVIRFTIIVKRVNEILEDVKDELGLEMPMEVKLEKIYNPVVFKGDFKLYKSGEVKFVKGTKKRYMALEVWKEGELRNRPMFVGFEAKRSDAAPFLQELQTEAGEILLRTMDTKKYVKRIRKEYTRLGRVELNKLATPKGLKNHPTDYTPPNAWTKAVLYAMRVLDQPWIQAIKPAIVYIKPKRVSKRKYQLIVPKVWRWKCDCLVNIGGKDVHPGGTFTDEEIPEEFKCPVCGNFAEIIVYPLETICSLTGDFEDLPVDFWDEWELDVKKMKEKLLKNKFAEMVISIGENWHHVEGKTTLDQFFGT